MSSSCRATRRRRRVYRQRLRQVQGAACYLCPQPLASRRATGDHVVPRALGGIWTANILLAHPLCNARKAGRAPFPCERLYLEAVNARMVALFGAQP